MASQNMVEGTSTGSATGIEQVRRNPGKSLLVSSAFRLILGAIFRRK